MEIFPESYFPREIMKSDWSLRSNINAPPYRGDCLEKKELDYPTIIWDYSRWERGCSLKTGERRWLADPAQRQTGKTACRPVSDFKWHGRRPCPAGLPAIAPWRRRAKPPVKPSQTESNHFTGLTGGIAVLPDRQRSRFIASRLG